MHCMADEEHKRRTLQRRSYACDPVVRRYEHGQPFQPGKTIQADDVVVRHVDAVKLVLQPQPECRECGVCTTSNYTRYVHCGCCWCM